MLPNTASAKTSRTFLSFVLFVVILSPSLHAQQPETTNSDFTSLFDGKTLDGWRGDQPYWSVRDGAIHGEITEDTRIKANHFLIYEGEIPAAVELAPKLLPDEWHEVRIKARGNVLEHIIDGQLMSYVADNDETNRRTTGRLGVQVHVGPPMTIEYRNLRVRALD